MRILVTGGAGFIGRHLVRELADGPNGHSVSIIDYHHGAEEYRHYDLTRPGVAEALIDEARPAVVIHLAAQVGRVFGEDDPAWTINSNATMTTFVAQAAAHAGARLVYASTSEVYGDLGDRLATEATYAAIRRVPHNLYGLSKAWGEETCALYAARESWSAAHTRSRFLGGLQVIRPSMPYGPGLPAGRGRAAIINMLDQAARGVEIATHDPAERSWCWIGDLVEAIRFVIEYGDVAYSPDEWQRGVGVYNIGNDAEAVPMRFVASAACRIVGRSQDEAARLIRLVEPPANQTAVKRLSMEKLRGLGWEPTVLLEDGMEETWKAMLADDPERYASFLWPDPPYTGPGSS